MVFKNIRSLLSRIYRYFRQSLGLGSTQKIWDGIYSSKDEIILKKNDWNWFSNWQYNEICKIIEKHNANPDDFFGGRSLRERSLFPLIISLVGQNKSTIKILDIGGGVGIDYLTILNYCKISAKIQYFIVDIPEVGKKVETIFKNFPDITYLNWESYSENCANLDVILFNSSVQYFDDYKEKILDITKLDAEYIVFIRLAAGHFNSYLTKQVNIPGVETPYWFINIEELRTLLSNSGYKLLYQSRGDIEYYQGNFSESYRMGRTWNFVFAKI